MKVILPLQRNCNDYQCGAEWGVYYELSDKDIRGINRIRLSSFQDAKRIQRENHSNQVDECKGGDGTGSVYHYLKFDQWSSGIVTTSRHSTT